MASPEVPPFTLVLSARRHCRAGAGAARVPVRLAPACDARRLAAVRRAGHHQQRHPLHADGLRPAAHRQRARRRAQRHHAAVHADRGARARRRGADASKVGGRAARRWPASACWWGRRRWAPTPRASIGMLCILGGTLSYALSALWMRRLRHIPPLVSSAAQLTCSTVMLLPHGGLRRPLLAAARARRAGHARRARRWRCSRPRSPTSCSSASARRRAPPTSCW